MPTATPRDMDPKFKDESAEALAAKEREEREAKERHDDDTPMIVHRQPYMNPETGQMEEKVHGPMPVSEWPAYELEHKL